MDNFVQNQLYRWTYDKIKSNPKYYGGDVGNPAIILTYLEEMKYLSISTVRHSVAVSRIRNKLLEKFPQYDNREKYKPKSRKKSTQANENHRKN